MKNRILDVGAVRSRYGKIGSVILSLLTSLLILLIFIGVVKDNARAAGNPRARAIEPPVRPASTIISSDITSDTIWNQAGSPYEVTTDISVLGNVTLTIEVGVVVQFQQYAGMTVLGKLMANGSATQPITITGTSPQPGWWDGIAFQGKAGSNLNHVVVEYGGPPISDRTADIIISSAFITVTNSLIRNSGKSGIFAEFGGVANIYNTSFTGNQYYAVLFKDGSVNPVLGGLAATGNGYNGVGIGHQGILQGNHTWENSGVPYIVEGDESVTSGATLTVEPGAEVHFLQNANLTVQGNLEALGTATHPITFTGEFTTPEPGWWHGLDINSGGVGTSATANLSHVSVAYAGGPGNQGLGGNLSVSNAVVTVTHSLFSEGSKDGIFVWCCASVNVTDSAFTGNGRYALQFMDAGIDPILQNLSAAGNVFDVVALDQGVHLGKHTWENSGIPYLVTGAQSVDQAATLTVEPGVEVQFGQNVDFSISGRLEAVGTPAQPITFTGSNQDAGWWSGFNVNGPLDRPAQLILDYATVEYGGVNGNLNINNAQVHIAHSKVRYGSANGMYVNSNASAVLIESTQIVDNAGYGVFNGDSGALLMAPNNWWGSASGPTVDGGVCNPSGAGSRVNVGVEFHPWLTSPGVTPPPDAPGQARILSLTPQRWLVPADGVTRLWVTITLRDGNGDPLAGRTVHLESDLGDVMDGNITDVRGQAYAYVTSSTPGDAHLSPRLAYEDACEAAREPTATVTFTPYDTGADLFPDAAAPYAADGIEISPLPVVQGVPTTLSARLINPNNFPISINATFGIAQLGLGLQFGPVGEVLGKIIPANGEGIVEVQWTPPASGHQCIQLIYAYQPASEQGLLVPEYTVGEILRNIDIEGGPPFPLWAKRKAGIGEPELELTVGEGGIIAGGTENYFYNTPSGRVQVRVSWGEGDYTWVWVYGPWGITAVPVKGLVRGDPPRQDYKILATVQKIPYTPAQAGPGLPAERATAASAVSEGLLDITAKLNAAYISLERYSGAANAGDIYWASQQAAALLYYYNQAGMAMLSEADNIDALLAELRNEGFSELYITPADLQVNQERLRSQGFNTLELEHLQTMGMSAGEIETLRQQILAMDAEQVELNFFTWWEAIATNLRQLGAGLAFQGDQGGAQFALQRAQQGVASQPEQTVDMNLYRIYSSSYPFQVGNPLTQTATIDLRVRPLDIPADWMMRTTPPSVTLAPGETMTATLILDAGLPIAQGARPRVAVEGYVEDQLIGGAVLDILVPQAVVFDGRLRIFLPMVERQVAGN